MKPYIDELYCGHCDKDTKQKITEAGHERDSSRDSFECLECGWIKYGLTGEWMHCQFEASTKKQRRKRKIGLFKIKGKI